MLLHGGLIRSAGSRPGAARSCGNTCNTEALFSVPEFQTKQQGDMKTELETQNIEINFTAERSATQSPFLRLAQARAMKQKLRIAFPPRRRESCQTRQAMLAALREAELADWEASGGDYLVSLHQPLV
jgi:hypothetical protein